MVLSVEYSSTTSTTKVRKAVSDSTSMQEHNIHIADGQ